MKLQRRTQIGHSFLILLFRAVPSVLRLITRLLILTILPRMQLQNMLFLFWLLEVARLEDGNVVDD